VITKSTRFGGFGTRFPQNMATTCGDLPSTTENLRENFENPGNSSLLMIIHRKRQPQMLKAPFNKNVAGADWKWFEDERVGIPPE